MSCSLDALNAPNNGAAPQMDKQQAERKHIGRGRLTCCSLLCPFSVQLLLTPFCSPPSPGAWALHLNRGNEETALEKNILKKSSNTRK